jgi:putative mRNA 3-end processing factor
VQADSADSAESGQGEHGFEFEPLFVRGSGAVFDYENGLRLRDIDVALDVPRRQRCGFISHAHADHVARHELTLCTPDTAELLRVRWGPRAVRALPYHQPLELAPCRLTALPAGHILGSAMLLVESAAGRLLYTGDFRLRPGATAAPARMPAADVLVMECTYGDPRYRFPSAEATTEQLLSCVRKALHVGRHPVIYAYALGKAQEVARILAVAGIRVLMHPKIAEISRAYQRLGVDLGEIAEYGSQPLEDVAILIPPGAARDGPALPRNRIDISVSGWALDSGMRRRRRADYHIPLSDHADYDELLECVEQVAPRVVYCFHGQPAFVDALRNLGVEAHWLSSTRVRP